MAKWTVNDIPDLAGKRAIVTGTGGLGFETALALAMRGCAVVIAGRNADKGAAAVRQIEQSAHNTSVTFEMVDLASLASIAAFGDRMGDRYDRVDLLINNAAVMAPPARLFTADRMELQLGTNFLGHFALTARIWPLLANGARARRVVTLSSVAARGATINFGDIQSARHYAPMTAYGQSKLACLVFALELDRRCRAARLPVRSMAAHPGISRTDLIPNGAGANSMAGRLRRALPFLFQPAAQGALPTLFAGTAHQADGGCYYGPDRMSETRGYPADARIPDQARDPVQAMRLWVLAEELTEVSFLPE